MGMGIKHRIGNGNGQWRRNRGFRRFNESGPRAPGAPSSGLRILRLKCTKFDFDWGSAPDLAGGAYSAPPDSLAEFGGRFASGGGAGLETRRGREVEGGEVEGEGKGGPQVTVEPGPLRGLLRHWEWEGMGNHLSGNGNYLHSHGNLFPKVLCCDELTKLLVLYL